MKIPLTDSENTLLNHNTIQEKLQSFFPELVCELSLKFHRIFTHFSNRKVETVWSRIERRIAKEMGKSSSQRNQNGVLQTSSWSARHCSEIRQAHEVNFQRNFHEISHKFRYTKDVNDTLKHLNESVDVLEDAVRSELKKNIDTKDKSIKDIIRAARAFDYTSKPLEVTAPLQSVFDSLVDEIAAFLGFLPRYFYVCLWLKLFNRNCCLEILKCIFKA